MQTSSINPPAKLQRRHTGTKPGEEIKVRVEGHARITKGDRPGVPSGQARQASKGHATNHIPSHSEFSLPGPGYAHLPKPCRRPPYAPAANCTNLRCDLRVHSSGLRYASRSGRKYKFLDELPPHDLQLVTDLDPETIDVIRAAILHRATSTAIAMPAGTGRPDPVDVNTGIRTHRGIILPELGKLINANRFKNGKETTREQDGYFVFVAVFEYSCDCSPKAKIDWYGSLSSPEYLPRDPNWHPVSRYRRYLDGLTVHVETEVSTTMAGGGSGKPRRKCYIAIADTPNPYQAGPQWIVVADVEWEDSNPKQHCTQAWEFTLGSNRVVGERNERISLERARKQTGRNWIGRVR